MKLTGKPIFLPERLNLSFLPQDARPGAQYFIHMIISSHYFHGTPRDEMVAINWTRNRKILSNNRKDAQWIRDQLVKRQIICTDNSYKPGGYSMGYAIGKKCRGKIVRSRITDPATLERIEKVQKPRHEDHIEKLRSWFDHLEINTELASDIIDLAMEQREREISEQLVNTKLSKKARRELQKKLRCSEDVRNMHDMAVAAIKEKDFDFIVDNFGRVHTNITRLLSGLRAAITISGKNLINIDMSNSQPLMFGLRIKQMINERNQGQQGEPSNNQTPTTNPVTQGATIHPNHHCCQRIHNKNRGFGDIPDSLIQDLEPELTAYLKACSSGSFYETLMVRFASRELTKEERSAFKVSVFRDIFYGKGNYTTPLTRAFAELYPKLFEVIRCLKAEDYRTLAREMQRAESSVIIGKVCKELAADHPDVPIYTIHDSIMTTPEHVQLVKEVITRHFQALGISPNLKTEDYESVRREVARRREGRRQAVVAA